MPFILHIDTATDKASVSLALDGKLIDQRINTEYKEHASWLHSAIKELTAINHIEKISDALSNLSAIAVVGGPGSYTGLRVGMAAAKGLAYALNVPLIVLNTLELLAHATRKENSPSVLLCPMLDARRMEVFAALYDASLKELIAPAPMVLNEDSFADWLRDNRIVFFGNGSIKWKEIVKSEHADFKQVDYTSQDIALIAFNKYNQSSFADLAYTEPLYLKEFFSYPEKTAG